MSLDDSFKHIQAFEQNNGHAHLFMQPWNQAIDRSALPKTDIEIEFDEIIESVRLCYDQR